MTEPIVYDAIECVLKAALRVLKAERGLGGSDPDADAEHEYACEQLALSARTLTDAINALPADRQPTGWHSTDHVKQHFDA